MITAAQLRAARGLLDWTRSDLAKAANVSPETIKNIEHGTFRPQETTARAIVEAFARRDVQFTENEGVSKVTNSIITYEGKQDFRRYADDIYEALLMSPQDRTICVFGNTDKLFVEALGDYAETHLARMAKLDGLRFRALMGADETVFATNYIEYRKLPGAPLSLPFSVGAGRFELITYGEGPQFPKVVAIKSQVVADAYRAQFDALWKISTAAT